MARKYQTTFTIPVGTPSDPNEDAFNAYLDLSRALSQRLQRNVRQGHVYNIHKVESQVLVPDSGNFDQGVAVSGTLAWCPATKNSVKAWQEAHKVWRAQKKLSINAIGDSVRYDDFEIGWSSNHAESNDRISSLYASGNADEDLEDIVIYGSSAAGDVVTLADLWMSAQDQAPPSRFPLSNAVVKQSKFVSEFPTAQKAGITCFWSASHVEGASFDTGATIQNGVSYVADGASLAGVLYVEGKMLPENTIGHIQDEVYLHITVTYSLGTSLLPYRRKKGGKKSRGKRSRRTYRKRG